MTEIAVPRQVLASAARALAHAGRWQDAAALLDAAPPGDPVLALTSAQVAVESDWFAGTTTAPHRLALAARHAAALDDEGRWDLAFAGVRTEYRAVLMVDPTDREAATALLHRTATLATTAPDAVRNGWAEMYQGLICDNLLDEPDTAPAHYRVALEAGAADPLLAREALRHLGGHDHDNGDAETALTRWRLATELGAAAGNVPGTLSQQLLLAVATRAAGNQAGALTLATEIARWATAIGAPALAAQATAFIGGADPFAPPPLPGTPAAPAPITSQPTRPSSAAPASAVPASAVPASAVPAPAVPAPASLPVGAAATRSAAPTASNKQPATAAAPSASTSTSPSSARSTAPASTGASDSHHGHCSHHRPGGGRTGGGRAVHDRAAGDHAAAMTGGCRHGHPSHGGRQRPVAVAAALTGRTERGADVGQEGCAVHQPQTKSKVIDRHRHIALAQRRDDQRLDPVPPATGEAAADPRHVHGRAEVQRVVADRRQCTPDRLITDWRPGAARLDAVLPDHVGHEHRRLHLQHPDGAEAEVVAGTFPMPAAVVALGLGPAAGHGENEARAPVPLVVADVGDDLRAARLGAGRVAFDDLQWCHGREHASRV
ncbi:hypothetical protein [Dactylosporangium sp. NPDC000521]|uniref:hypothetical protein n=1 Tax=Dactylosporangium sp. NPDC000521 TaxID=3363975 RepID=UPI0036982A3B